MDYLIYAGIAVGILLVIGLIVTRLYKRATKEIAYVRTGFRGQKVIMDGGALVLPVLHEIMPVNMNTQRLGVTRKATEALITKDKLRVDVVAEFYVRVRPDAEAIAIAAQTLGNRTMKPELVKDLIEGKFVDALRSVAAGMTMEELHTNRATFVQKVLEVSSSDLNMNGLELESVSLTGLDQTSKEHFNEDNAFDAEGLTILTRQIEQRRKERNEVVQETAVAIAEKNREANLKRLDIEKQDREATLDQEREIAVKTANQKAEIAREDAASRKAIETADIEATQEIETRQIESNQATQAATIAAEEKIQTAEIGRQKAVELARQQQSIEISTKSREESEAKASADLARAEAVRAREAVQTAEKVAVADRDKQIALIAANQAAEQDAVGIKVSAAAEKQAAADRAEAKRLEAKGVADALTLQAAGEAEAEKLRAEAAEATYTVKAKGEEALNLAANRLSKELVQQRVSLAAIEALPNIIEQSVKPMQNIDSIRIVEVGGLGGEKVSQIGEGGEGLIRAPSNLAEAAVTAGLRYRAEAPIIDSLMKSVGLENLEGVVTKAMTPAE